MKLSVGDLVTAPKYDGGDGTVYQIVKIKSTSQSIIIKEVDAEWPSPVSVPADWCVPVSSGDSGGSD